MDSMHEKAMEDEDEEIKKKPCEKIREKNEKCKATLKKIKEEFQKKNENKDTIKSMMFIIICINKQAF